LHHVALGGVGTFQHLDCRHLVETRVACPVDRGKAATTDLFEDFVLA
jgi:hypothetical protein